jgi:hypothetical protein
VGNKNLSLLQFWRLILRTLLMLIKEFEMKYIKLSVLITLASLTMLIIFTGCKRDTSTLSPAEYPTNGDVYIDGFSGGLDYEAFSNSKLDAFEVDYKEKYKGTSSMRITVPSVNDPSGWFAGGAYISYPRDLSGYNAITFWGKASQVATVALVGFGNDNTGESKYTAWQEELTFTTIWQKYIIPIPNPEKLQAEKGMFQYSAGADENGNGYYIWFDEVQFEKVGTIAHPVADIGTQTIFSFIGDTVSIGVISVKVDGVDNEVKAYPAYLDFYANNDTVVSIENGVIRVIGDGSTVITAKLGGLDANGSITVDVGGLVPAPEPSFDPSNVISLFSNVYYNVTVDTWNPHWQYSTTENSEVTLGGDDIIQYTSLNFVGIEFVSNTLDVSEMTHFYMDMWTPDPSALPASFSIELVDFGANNAYGGGDDSSHKLTFNANTTPALVTDQWIRFDIPLSQFTGLKAVKNMAQLVLSTPADTPPNTVYIDNVLFHK